jgi:hypothetical protein
LEQHGVVSRVSKNKSILWCKLVFKSRKKQREPILPLEEEFRPIKVPSLEAANMLKSEYNALARLIFLNDKIGSLAFELYKIDPKNILYRDRLRETYKEARKYCKELKRKTPEETRKIEDAEALIEFCRRVESLLAESDYAK